MLASQGPADAAALAFAGSHLEGGRESEAFDRRQPEHVILAGMAGLGLFDANLIEHRRIRLPA
jgi:hypothetical protein